MQLEGILRYVDTFEEEAEIDIEAVQKEIDTLENEVEVRGKMANTLKEAAVWAKRKIKRQQFAHRQQNT